MTQADMKGPAQLRPGLADLAVARPNAATSELLVSKVAVDIALSWKTPRIVHLLHRAIYGLL